MSFHGDNLSVSTDILRREPYNKLAKDKEVSSNIEEYFCYAIQLAENAKFRETLEYLFQCYKRYTFTSDQIYEIIQTLIENLKAETREHLSINSIDITTLCCPNCYGVLLDPVTVSCGHTYCKRCLTIDTIITCKLCRETIKCSNKQLDLRQNVLVSSLVCKWWSRELQGAKLRALGNDKFIENKYEEAVKLYTIALEYSPYDHLVLSNRSHVLHNQGHLEDALTDADAAIRSCPEWAKGHLRRAMALQALGRIEDALVTLLVCAVLEDSTKVKSVIGEIVTLLHLFLTGATSQRTSLEAKMCYHSRSHTKSPNQPTNNQHHNYTSPTNNHHHNYTSSTNNHHHNYTSYIPYTYKESQQSDGEMSIDDEDDEDDFDEGSMDYNFNTSLDTCTKNTNKQVKSDKLVHGRKRNSSDSNPTIEDNCSEYSDNSGRLFDKYNLEMDKIKKSYSRYQRSVELQDEEKSSFECTLCFRYFLLPVTTPCGHTFCKHCLDRCLDHSPDCPLCKASLKDYLAERRCSVTEFVEYAMQTMMLSDYEERHNQHEIEMDELARAGEDLQHEIPIFVATLSIPTISCPLHVFEPRYRLMIRRCMESGTREFGMCMPSKTEDNGYAQCGTLLEILDIEYTPDGRSVVNTVGSRRFKIIKKAIRDGYNTASVHFLKDTTITNCSLPNIQKLHDSVHMKACEWFNSIDSQIKRRILNYYGTMPEVEQEYHLLHNGPAWMWWIVNILPLDSTIQLKIIEQTSLSVRLKQIAQILCCLMKRQTTQQ